MMRQNGNWDVHKENLTERMKSLGAFWSYDKEKLHDIPDKVLIEETLRWGDVEEILLLLRLYPKKVIREVWQDHIVPDQRIYEHNYYLAKIFFNIELPDSYLKTIMSQNNRHERIRKNESKYVVSEGEVQGLLRFVCTQ